MGTDVCVNILVPHTGSAVYGVWPLVVQGCAVQKRLKTTKKIVRIIFIDPVSVSTSVVN